MISTLRPAPARPSVAASDGTRGAIVTIAGLTKAFPVRRGWGEMLRRPLRNADRVTVVDDVSFEVGPAEFFGLLGANGAGKTTLFRMLGTQLLPDSGSAVVAGADIVRSPHQVRRLLTPVLADERSLNWRLTARENLELFAALYGVDRRRVTQRIDELLGTVELRDAGTKMVGSFSSGMKQRLLIARALLAQPRVLLLDEPTRSLDPVSARRFRRFLRDEIAGRQQCTVLLATHNAEEAFELCDRVAVLERGRVLAVGRAEELLGQVRDDRYHLTVRHSHAPAAVSMLSRGDDVVARDHPTAPGWTVLDLRIPDGAEGAADVLARLTHSAIDVSGLEHRTMTLADLLERIVQRKAGA